jgi:hypothetical protein
MNTQPEALRLAEQHDFMVLGSQAKQTIIIRFFKDTAAELRRLHDENERLLAANKDVLNNFEVLMYERNELVVANQELVEALEWIVRVNAMDYEYKQKAKEVLTKQHFGVEE